jgi:hypothetical protein
MGRYRNEKTIEALVNVYKVNLIAVVKLGIYLLFCFGMT